MSPYSALSNGSSNLHYSGESLPRFLILTLFYLFLSPLIQRCTRTKKTVAVSHILWPQNTMRSNELLFSVTTQLDLLKM